MSESYFAQISEIVKAALLEQDARTYSGYGNDTSELAEEATRKILEVVSAEENDRKQREFLNPVRGIHLHFPNDR